MSLYYNKNVGMLDEVGDIKHINPLSSEEESIIGVFKGESMVWPKDSKYVLDVSDTKEMNWKPTKTNTIYFDANEQEKTIYVKSRDKYNNDKFPLKVFCPDDAWYTIDGNAPDDLVGVNVDVDGQPIEKGSKYDITFTIKAKTNTSAQDRESRILITQYNKDPYQRGKQTYIAIKQSKDNLASEPDYSNAMVQWYSDSMFTTPIDEYSGISVNGGYVNVYVSIIGNARMQSGLKDIVYYGDREEPAPSLVFDNKMFARVASTKYQGYGRWIVTLECFKNYNGSFTKNITNLKTNGDITYSGGNFQLYWEMTRSADVKEKTSNLSVYIPTAKDDNGNYVGYATIGPKARLLQSGGHIVEPTTNAELSRCSVTVESGNEDWCKTNGDVFTSDGLYKQNLHISKQTSSNKLYIGEDNISGTEIGYEGTSNGKVTFPIYMKENSSQARNAKLYISCDGVQSSYILRQNGNNEYNIVNVDDTILNQSQISVSPTNAEDTFIRYSDVGYDSDSGEWFVSFSCEENPQKTVENEIYIEAIGNTTDYTSKTIEIQFSVISGIRNSNKRHSSMHLSIPEYSFESDIIELTQTGTNDSETIQYDEEAANHIKVHNISDDTFGRNEVNPDTSWIVKSYIDILENQEKKNDVVSVWPTGMSQWSFSEIDNDGNAKVHVKVTGNKVYEGMQRDIDIVFSCEDPSYGIQPLSEKIVQEGNPTILSDDLGGCSELAMSDFSLKPGSEGELIESSTAISDKEGIYEMIVKVKPNDKPTRYLLHANVGNKMVKNIESRYGEETNITTEEISLNSRYDDFATPIMVWWRNIGEPTTRTVTISVASIEKELVCVWDKVYYTGETTSHATIGNGYSLELYNETAPNTNWIKTDKGNIITMSNQSDRTRKATIDILYNTSDGVRKSVAIPVKQDVKSKDVGYVLYTDFASGEQLYIDTINRRTSLNFTVTSYDDDTNTVLPFDVKCISGDMTSLVVKKKVFGIYTDVEITAYGPNETDSDKTWQFEILQSKSGKTTGFSVIQRRSYIDISYDGIEQDTIYTDINNTAEISVVESVENGTYARPNISMSQDWAIAEMTDTNKISVSCSSINFTAHDRTCIMTIEQPNTGIKRLVHINNKCWAVPEFDDSPIHLYREGQEITRTFMSSESRMSIEPQISAKYNSFNNMQMTVSLEDRNDIMDGMWELKVKSNISIDGYIPKFCGYQICNKNMNIGFAEIALHAFVLNDNSESTWYLSPKRNEVWSMYYITSMIDGEFCDYDVEISNGNGNTAKNISVKKDRNCLIFKTSSDNTTDERIEYSCKITQHNSLKTINVKLVQYTMDDYETVYF